MGMGFFIFRKSFFAFRTCAACPRSLLLKSRHSHFIPEILNDKHIDNPDTPPTIRFRLTDNDLIVENFGENAKAFTRKGVISICYTSLSAKSNHITDLKCGNSELPDKIGEELKQLKPNSRRAHIGNETRTIKEYFGRFVLELLQNADDAVNKESDEMIGMKGLGFKSIFEITDEPEIRSGDFHFRLKKESDGLRIPECIKVVECAATTQIRLPFRDDAAKKSAQAAIGEIESMRAGILLFCQSLQRIDIEIDGLPSRRLEIRIVPRDDEKTKSASTKSASTILNLSKKAAKK